MCYLALPILAKQTHTGADVLDSGVNAVQWKLGPEISGQEKSMAIVHAGLGQVEGVLVLGASHSSVFGLGLIVFNAGQGGGQRGAPV